MNSAASTPQIREVTGVRPRPFLLEDTEFWWAGAAEGRLLVQKCTECGCLRHPPSPTCATCLSFAWEAIEASGEGTIHSLVVSHHPRHEAFAYPLTIVLVDLAEGTRLVAGYDGPEGSAVIGAPVRVTWIRDEAGTTLPVFVPAASQHEGGAA